MFNVSMNTQIKEELLLTYLYTGFFYSHIVLTLGEYVCCYHMCPVQISETRKMDFVSEIKLNVNESGFDFFSIALRQRF